MSEQKTDILIVGGGIAGCIAAISLVENYRVTLIDKLLEPKERIGESLAPAANRILAELQLLEDLEKQTPSLYKQNLGMQSFWGSEQAQFTDYFGNPDGMVKNLDRQAFEKYLRQATEARGVRCYWGFKLQTAENEKSGWKVRCNSTDGETQTIAATFVIDASGRQSHFARSLGIKRKITDKLIACWLSLDNSMENTMSLISAAENGWWYSAVVPNQKRILAFHTDSDLIDRNSLKSADSLLQLASDKAEIQALIKGHENSLEFQGTVAANSSKLQKFAGNNWIALGDAALSFDPLSSQGMFNAMATAMQLRDLIFQFGFTETLSKQCTGQMEQIWQHYLKHKRLYYQAESRWQNAPFWQRRQRRESRL